MSANVQAPPIRAPRVSLISSSDIIDIPGEKWERGIELYPLSGNDASGLWPVCPDPESEATKDARNSVGGQSFQPFAVYATDSCSTFGSGGINFTDRARDKLAVVESYWIERELWTGSLAVGNPSFETSPTITVTAAAEDPISAFAQIDGAVANDLHDGRGMLHMPTDLFSYLAQYTIFRREGNIWLSPLDNIVVPGRGYMHTGPEGEAGLWIFGHPGIIQITRGPVIDLPTREEVEKQMERPWNNIKALAERVVAFVVSNGVGDDEGDNVTGFYAAEVTEPFTPFGS